ncbi:hypothetical protein R3W88_014177 [Solanum pinnatisectum]|uniref:F-box domain-containing protein n=1 Tax=Solanum pinnatisectum TaxID=50273 RepID=A0AAV9KQZ0_9SOLN|nr:hypothetical protein R3W88_014177 [Solanum pinnatisectum]
MNEEKNRFRDQLGDDIVFEILTWIPAKSLMRFRCVCKDWNALIRQDPNFVIRCVSTHISFQLHVLHSKRQSSLQHIFSPRRFSLQLAPLFNLDGRSGIIICSNQCNSLFFFFLVIHIDFTYTMSPLERSNLCYSVRVNTQYGRICFWDLILSLLTTLWENLVSYLVGICTTEAIFRITNLTCRLNNIT